MLSLWQSPNQLTRRKWLEVGSLALGSLALPDLLRQQALAVEVDAAKQPKRQTSVIQVFMGGGPSHIDLYDLKPEAPAEIRGEFRPINTSVSGVQLSEHLPHLAQAMMHLAIVRSASHGNASHLPASHWMMTGHQPSPTATSNLNPSLGSVVARTRGPNVVGLPAYVSVPRRQLLGGAAYLGSAYQPFTTESDPNAANYNVRNLTFPAGMNVSRLNDRQGLLRGFDRLRTDLDRHGELAGIDKFSREAIEIITSTQAQQAFDLNREDARTRGLYGRTQAGQGCLLARRLVEAGVTFVTVLTGGQWDTHVDNFNILKNDSLPMFDRALAGLVTDLHQRGMHRDVLVLVNGEFGRTPKINERAGRDHWPGAFSVLFSGGGMPMGQVIGATDTHAAYPVTHPYSPGDVLATVYQFLGIDIHTEFHDRSGRPMPILPEGRPIAELMRASS